MKNRKVNVEITPEKATIKINYDGKTFTQSWTPTKTGAKATGSLDDIAEINEQLYDELSGFFATSVMSALNE